MFRCDLAKRTTYIGLIVLVCMFALSEATAGETATTGKKAPPPAQPIEPSPSYWEGDYLTTDCGGRRTRLE